MGVCPAAPKGGRAGRAVDSEADLVERVVDVDVDLELVLDLGELSWNESLIDQLSEKSSLNESVSHSLSV